MTISEVHVRMLLGGRHVKAAKSSIYNSFVPVASGLAPYVCEKMQPPASRIMHGMACVHKIVTYPTIWWSPGWIGARSMLPIQNKPKNATITDRMESRRPTSKDELSGERVRIDHRPGSTQKASLQRQGT